MYIHVFYKALLDYMYCTVSGWAILKLFTVHAVCILYAPLFYMYCTCTCTYSYSVHVHVCSVPLIQVINADSLLVPVMEKANEIALSEAKEKVKEEVMARLTIEQNSKKGTTANTYMYIIIMYSV